jgi:hypothetical protein
VRRKDKAACGFGRACPEGLAAMSSQIATRSGNDADFDAIAEAVMETERGRWFLKEYARRNRHADTELLLGAITRIEQAVSGQREQQDQGVNRFRGDLMDMAKAIAATRAAASDIFPELSARGRLTDVSDELDAIVSVTEKATSDILGSAENVQDLAWTLREQGADIRMCDNLDAHATEIYTACSFQDLTAQRARKVMQTLHFLEDRIRSIVTLWEDGNEVQGQGTSDNGKVVFAHSSQADIDFVLVDDDDSPPMPTALDLAATLPVLPDFDDNARDPATAAAVMVPPQAAADSDEVLFTAELSSARPEGSVAQLHAVENRSEPDLATMGLADRTRLFS